MATSDNTPSHRDASSDSEDSDSGSDNGSESGSQAQQVEWLATGREKRSTAGNRMKSMLANEEPAADDSDLELLFAEDEDDAGFTDVDKNDASDVQMDSSSDDEDENAAAADDDAGEKELQRQAKEKRAAMRKRKAQEAIPVKFRKKVRISQPAAGPSATTAPAPRPKKKSERASWLPSPADLPTRSSDRQTTRMSKEQLHQQMIEREIKRKKQLEIMEKKAKRLEALKKPPMTQAERLIEAASVEKRNSKSLNRWEEAEKQREEERKAKLAALNNRRLEGPVVTFWSGIVDLSETQLKNVGKMVSMEDKPRKKRQSAAAAKAEAEAKASEQTTPVPTTTTTQDTAGSQTIKQEQEVAGPQSKDTDSSAVSKPAASEPAVTEPPPSAPPVPNAAPGATPPSTNTVMETTSQPFTSATLELVPPTLPTPQRSIGADGLAPIPLSSFEPPMEVQAIPPSPTPVSQQLTNGEPPALNPPPQASAEPATQPPTPPPPTQAASLQPPLQTPNPPLQANPQPLLQPPTPPPPPQVVIPHPPLQSPNPPLQSPSSGPSEVAQALASPPLQRNDSGSRLMAPPPIPPPPDMIPQRSVLAPPAGAMPGMLNSPMPMLGYSSTPNHRPNVLAAPNPPRTGSPLSHPAINQAPPMVNPRAPHTPAPTIQGPTAGPPTSLPAPTVQPQAQQSLPQPALVTAGPEASEKKGSVTPSQSTPVPPAKARKASKAAEKQEVQEPPAPDPPLEGKVTRSCIMLQDFDEDAIKSPAVQTQILFGWKMSKLGKPPHPPICAITGHPARYKDPKTGLPYYNGYAYREIQRISKGDYKWSSLVGAWVGNGSFAAKGVPSRFLGGPKEVAKPPAPTEAAPASGEPAREQATTEQPATEPVALSVPATEMVEETQAQVA